MGEVGDADDDFFADPQRLLQRERWFFDLLKRLVQDNVVKGVVRVFGEPRVDVLLDRRLTLGDASDDGLLI